MGTNFQHAKVAERYQALTQSLKDRVSLDSDYKEKVRKLETKLKNVSECLSTINCKGESLEEKVNNLLEERIHLIDAEKRLKVEIEEMMAEKEKQAADLTVTVAKLSEFEQERNALAVSLNKFFKSHRLVVKDEAVRSNLISSSQNLTVKIYCRLEKERKDKDAEFDVLKMEMINIKDENKNKEDIINSLEAEMVALKEVTASMNKSKDETSVVLVKKKLELEQLEKERNDKDAELNVLKTEMINLTNDNKNKDEIINSLKAEVVVLNKVAANMKF
ncbi:unnamed protein product [Onchocerca flexuosa]|uniref:Uncharacterized protein n=1 Tax=Onchocerca flexuosa TaxID=387005 RepID=A0A183HJ86_9BILA|nr:unnamed protein product [Onchocerca flexuosa]